jgi:dihydrodipicolinate synthase/N-acetylneuraminate lyase
VNIQGVCPVLSVPFHPNGEVDYQSFDRLVNWITSLGTKSVLFFGVASENIKLSDAERYKLLESLLNLRTETGMKVIASVADHSADLAVKRAKDYEKMGADFYFPAFEYCTDNAAMIGRAAYFKYQQKMFAELSEGTESRLAIGHS